MIRYKKLFLILGLPAATLMPPHSNATPNCGAGGNTLSAHLNEALYEAEMIDSEWGRLPRIVKSIVEELLEETTQEDRTLKDLVDPSSVPEAKGYSVDKPFPRSGESNPVRNLKYNGEEIDYQALDDAAKYIGYNHPLYFGKAMKYFGDETDEATKMIKVWNKTRFQLIKMFEKGRSKWADGPTTPHSDIFAHQETTKDAPSMFIQTTANYNVARDYGTDYALSDADKARMGIVYLIDPHNVELFDIAEAMKLMGRTDSFNEDEVLLYENLAADRVIGAMIYQTPEGGGEMVPIGFVRNPNWISHYPE